jgi:hypothetical protein
MGKISITNFGEITLPCHVAKKNTNLLFVRVHHGHRNTHGFSKTGIADTGMVLHFGMPQHTATHTRGITGIHR